MATDPSFGGVALHFATGVERAQLAQILDLIFEDTRLNVYAGELEVRPPGPPTIFPASD